MAVRKHIGVKVNEDDFRIIEAFCEKSGISKSALVLDGLNMAMGKDSRVYEQVNELQERVQVLEGARKRLNAENRELRQRGIFARIFNKGV